MTQSRELTVTWRPLSVEDQASLGPLYDAAFRLEGNAHYLDDFPVWNPWVQVGHRRQIGAFAGAQLLAAAGSRRVKLHGVEGEVVLIGGVAVLPGFQGKGLATGAIERLLVEEKDLEEICCALWGSEKSLYGRFGFKDAGIQKRTPLSSLQLQSGALPIEIGFSDVLGKALASARREGAVLSAQEIALIRESKNIQWLHVRDGEEIAFAGVGKGIDLPGMIHTWGGSARLLQRLLGEIKAKISEHLEILWHPSQESQYPFLAGARAYEREHLAMIRVGSNSLVNPDQLWFWGTDSC